jgi:hypothetical protein
MAGDDDLKNLVIRLEKLEAKVETVSRPNKVTELTAEDIAAYHKVQMAFWEDGTCGINETSPCILKCNIFTQGVVVPIPKACDRECTCGPCNIFGPMFNLAEFRFRGLGG